VHSHDLSSTDAGLFTIGQLAARTGLTSRTIRFWSDAGLVPPAGRSASGYRLYDAEAPARLDLVRTLRELGLGLEVVRAVLSRARLRVADRRPAQRLAAMSRAAAVAIMAG
jgi:DNA-binding transcriptional MerR regulator